MANFLINVAVAVLKTVGMKAAAVAAIGQTGLAVIGGSILVGGALVAKKVMGLFEIQMPKIDTDGSRQSTNKGTTEPHKIIYGETLVSGPVVFVATAGADNKDLYYAVALAGHEVEDITDIHFDNEVIADADIAATTSTASTSGAVSGSGTFGPKGSPSTTICHVNKHLGTATQAADSLLRAAKPSKWTTAHQGKGIAYIVTKWVLNDDSAETWDKFTPNNIKAVVKGRKIYDPRLDSTQTAISGSGSHRLADSTTWQYSTNPALAVADYLMNADFGLGVSSSKIDWAAIKTAADGCDVSVSVPGGTQSRFTCNGVLFGTDSHKTNINKLLSAMNGSIAYIDGYYVVKAGIYENPVVDLDEDDLSGSISIKTSLERGDRFNTVKGVFIDPASNHKSTEFPKVQLSTAYNRDNQEELHKEIALNMTNSSYMAQRIAHKLIQQSDLQKIITYPTNMKGLRVAVGDRVRVTNTELSWTLKEFQCVQWSFNEEGGVTLLLREEDSQKYADPTVTPSNEYSTVTSDGVLEDAFRGVPTPSGLRVVSGEGKVFLDWVNPGNPQEFQTVHVLVSSDNNLANAVKAGETDGSQFVHDSAASAGDATEYAVGDTRYYWVRAVNFVGTSDEARSSAHGSQSVTVLATAVTWSNVADPTIGIQLDTDDSIEIVYNAETQTSGSAIATSGIEEDVTITQGGITMSNGGAIRGGQTAFDTGEGFFLGYVSGDNRYKFSIGDSSDEKLTFDDGDLTVTGDITAKSGSIAQSVTIGGGTTTAVQVSNAASGQYFGKDLAHYWPCNEIISGEIPELIAGKDGVISGSNYASDIDSPTGKAYKQTGTSVGATLLNDTDSNALETSAGFAWSFWFRSDTSSGVNDARIISNDLSDGYGLLIDQSGSSQGLTFYGEPGAESVGTVSEGEWHHFVFSSGAFTSGSSTISLYLDGVLVGTESYTPVASSRPVVIGCNTESTIDTANDVFIGAITEIRAYSRTLTADDVQALYENPNGAIDQTVNKTGGTVGGININSSSIFSGSHNAYSSTAQGFFIGSDGTMSFGDGSQQTLTFDSSGNLEITGTVNATGGTFSGTVQVDDYITVGGSSSTATIAGISGVTSSDLRMWAGDTFANSETAPFRVESDGTVIASRLIVTQPNDTTSVIFDSAEDGLVGVGLSNLSQETGIVVQEPSAVLSSQTATQAVTLSSTQTLTLTVTMELPYPKVTNSTTHVATDYPSDITATIQYSTDNGSNWSTFGSAVVKQRELSNVSSDNTKFGVRIYALDGNLAGYIRNYHAIDAAGNLILSESASLGADDYLFRVQLSSTNGNDSRFNPDLTAARTLKFETDAAGFTVAANGTIIDAPGNTATIGYVSSNYAALESTNTFKMGSGEYHLFEDDSGNDVLNIQQSKTSAYKLLEVVHGDAIPGTAQNDIIFKVRGGSSSNQDLFTINKAGSFTASSGTLSGNLVVTGDLTIQGTTTTIDTANLNVEDKNITLNYGTGDTSANADGAGITVQDAVDSSTDATILWSTSSDTFDFSHGIITSGNITSSGNISYVPENINNSGTDMTGLSAGWYTWTSTPPTDAPFNYGIMVQLSDPNQKIQLVYGSSSNGRLAIRRADSGTFYSWTEFWSNADFSSTQVTNWDTAYTYSQVGHLPLAGGTLTGSLTGTSATFNGNVSAQNLTLLASSGHTTFTLGSRSADPTPTDDGSYDFKPGMRVSAFEPSDGTVNGMADLPFVWIDANPSTTSEGYLAASETYATATFSKTFTVNNANGTRWFAKLKTNDAEDGNDPRFAVNGGTEYELSYTDAAPSNGENDTDAWHVIDITDDVVTGSNTLKVWLEGGQKTYILAVYVFPSTGIMLPNEPYESVGYFHKGIGVGDTRIVSSSRNLINIGDITLAEKIIHDGDTNTFIQFDNDIIDFETGGSSRFTIDNNNVSIKDADVEFNNGVFGLKYLPQESTAYASPRFFLIFDYTDNASFPYLTNRTPSGKVEIHSASNTSGGSETVRMRFMGGAASTDIDILNATLDLNSNNIKAIGEISGGVVTTGQLTTQADSAAAGLNIKRTNAGSGGAKGFIAFRDLDGYATAAIDSLATGGDNNGTLRFHTSAAAAETDPYSLAVALTLNNDQSATFAGDVDLSSGNLELNSVVRINNAGNATLGTITGSSVTVSSGGPTLTLSDTGNGGGGGAEGKIIFANTGGDAIGIGYTADQSADSDLIISTNAGGTYGGYLGLDAAAISDAQSDIILEPKTNVRIAKVASTNGVYYPLSIEAYDLGNTFNQVIGDGIGLRFKLAGNDTSGDSNIGAAIAAIREHDTDANSNTGLSFRVSQNDETLDEALRLANDLTATFSGDIDLSDNDIIQVKTITVDGAPSTNTTVLVHGQGQASNNWAGRFENQHASGYGLLGITASNSSSQSAFEIRKNTSDQAMLIRGDGNTYLNYDTFINSNLYVDSSDSLPLDVNGTAASGLVYSQFVNDAISSIYNTVGLEFRLNSSTQERQAHLFESKFTTTTDASRTSRLNLYGYSGGSQIYYSFDGGNLTLSSGTFTVNSGTTNVGATFTSSDAVSAIKLQDDTGNVELSSLGGNFRVQPSGSTVMFTVGTSGHVDALGPAYAETQLFPKNADEPDEQQANAALSGWVCMVASTVNTAVLEPDTVIYEFDPATGNEQVWAVRNPTDTNTLTTTVQRIYRTKGQPFVMHHQGAHDHMVPLAYAGNLFGIYSSRYTPQKIHFYAPTGGARVNVYEGNGGIAGTPDDTFDILPNQFKDYTCATQTGTFLFEVIGSALCASLEGSGGGDYDVLRPAARFRYFGDSTFGFAERERIYDGSDTTVASSNTVAYAYDSPVWGIKIGDGGGGDCLTGVPLQMLCDNYLIPHSMAGITFVAPYPDTTIKVYEHNGTTWALINTYTLDGSITNPAYTTDGTNLDGGGTGYTASGRSVLVVGNKPFLVSTNDNSDDEYECHGWLSKYYNSMPKQSSVFAGYDGTTSLPNFTFADDTNTGMWRSAADTLNFSTGGTERLELGTNRALFAANVQVGSDQASYNAYGRLQVNQAADNDESGIGILSSSSGRSMRLWTDSTTSYINSGDGGSGDLVFNEAVTVSSGGNLSGVGTIGSGAITSTGRSTFDSVTIDDDGSATPLLRIVADDHTPWAFHIENASATNSGLFQAYINNNNDIYFRGTEQGAYQNWYFQLNNATTVISALHLHETGVDFAGKLAVGTSIDADSYIEAGEASGGVALTVNDGGGNANLAFNHNDEFTRVAGSWTRIKTDVDGTTAAFEVYIHDNVAANTEYSYNAGLLAIDAKTSRIQFMGDEAEIDSTGNAVFEGNVTAYGTASDIRLKSGVQVIPDALAKVQKLRGVTFTYDKDGSRSTGLIAQEVMEVLPEVVYETHEINDDEPFYALRYGNTVGLLVEAIKEQQGIIEDLKKRIEDLENGDDAD